MSIVSTDIKLKHSVVTGSAGNSTAGTGAGSLGKYISTTEHTGAANDIFDDVSGADNAASNVEYRCFFAHNSHGSLTLLNAVVWIASETAGGTDLDISVDTTTASPVGQASAQAKEIADEDTAPSAQTFTSPTTRSTGLSLGSIAAGECKAIWIRRTATDSGAVNNDGGTITVGGDTEA